MPNEPELIVDTVVDPRKWEEAITLLHESLRFIEDGTAMKRDVARFLEENA